MMLTRVVESARVNAAVKRAHMAALKRRFMLKKKARTPRSMSLLSGGKEKRVAMWEDRVDVRAVVVLFVGKQY